MKRIITSVNWFLAESCGYLLMLVMFLTAGDVVLRNVGIPVFGIVEMAVFIVVAAVYFGLGHCEEEDGHVRISAIVSRLSPVPRHFVRLAADLLTLAIMLLAAYACVKSAINAFWSNEAVMANQTPLYSWPARSAMVLGLVFYCCQIVISIYNDWSAFKHALDGKKGAGR